MRESINNPFYEPIAALSIIALLKTRLQQQTDILKSTEFSK